MKGNLQEIFEKENLIVPDYNKLNLVNLVRTLYNRYDANYEIDKNMKYIDKLIPKSKHTLFILIDGMGSNLVASLDDETIIKKNKKIDMITVSPSTTGCVLTSLATGEYPNKHGIIGWYSYNRENNIDYYPLLFADRKNKKSLECYGIKSSDIFKCESMLNKLNVNTRVLYPKCICDSIYSKFVADDSKRIGYDDYDEVSMIIKKITNSNEDTFTYLYIPNIDNLEHENGVYSDIVKDEMGKINNMLDSLSDINDLTIVITADHGQINIDHDVIMDFSKYKNYFYGLPGIDFATAIYYVKSEMKESFEYVFNKDFKDRMYLFKIEEFLENNIFGLGDASSYFKINMGEYVSICKNGYCFINSEDTNEYLGTILGNHSGFSKDEMIIPLVVINNKK